MIFVWQAVHFPIVVLLPTLTTRLSLQLPSNFGQFFIYLYHSHLAPIYNREGIPQAPIHFFIEVFPSLLQLDLWIFFILFSPSASIPAWVFSILIWVFSIHIWVFYLHLLFSGLDLHWSQFPDTDMSQSTGCELHPPQVVTIMIVIFWVVELPHIESVVFSFYVCWLAPDSAMTPFPFTQMVVGNGRRRIFVVEAAVELALPSLIFLLLFLLLVLLAFLWLLNLTIEFFPVPGYFVFLLVGLIRESSCTDGLGVAACERARGRGHVDLLSNMSDWHPLLTLLLFPWTKILLLFWTILDGQSMPLAQFVFFSEDIEFLGVHQLHILNFPPILALSLTPHLLFLP